MYTFFRISDSFRFLFLREILGVRIFSSDCDNSGPFAYNGEKRQNSLNKEEYIQLIGQHRNLIYKVCLSFCRDPEDRKDLEQEILIRIWNGIGKFDGQVKPSTWIYKVALNTAISFYRTERKRGSRTPMQEAVFSLPDASEADAEIRRNVDRLYRFIGELKELDRALILLYLDDLKYSEMANIIGITETNVATKINRIKEKLRKKFERHEPSE